MYLVKGRREAVIRRIAIHSMACPECRQFDWQITISRRYWHLFFIPVIPWGPKTATVQCQACHTLLEAPDLAAAYLAETRTPPYYYSGLFLLGLFGAWTVFSYTRNQQNKKEWVAHPQPGDVYQLPTAQKGPRRFYYVKVARVYHDSVTAYPCRNTYKALSWHLATDDYFSVRDSVVFTNRRLQPLLDQGGISQVLRNYGADRGFDRVQ